MDINQISSEIIRCAIEVHKTLGAGLLEKIYEEALCIELKNSGLKFERQKKLPVFYKDQKIGEKILDLIVEEKIVVEIKSTDQDNPVFQAQLLSYMKIGSYKLGLLINFNKKLLKDGIKRLILRK